VGGSYLQNIHPLSPAFAGSVALLAPFLGLPLRFTPGFILSPAFAG
jgi:hypothetical protein